LKELGEIERIAGNKMTTTTGDDNKETGRNDHFAKMNQRLYDKFNYDKLNASQFIVITAPENQPRTSTHRANRSEIFGDEKADFSDPKATWSRMRDMHSEGSMARLSAYEGTESPNTYSWKRHSMTMSKNNLASKKNRKLKRAGTMEDLPRPLTSDKCKLR